MSAESEDWLAPIIDRVVSEVKQSGYFAKVNGFEAVRSAGPRVSLFASVWVQDIEPVKIGGLAATSARILFIVRMYASIMPYPRDDVDPSLLRACSNLMRRFHDDFDFGGIIRNVDLLGEQGIALRAEAGYIDLDANTKFRVMDLWVPCLVNDVWAQVS